MLRIRPAASGLRRPIADELFALGVDVLTTGNHVWDKREIYDYLNRQPRLLRPANYVDDTPGKGAVVVKAHKRRGPAPW